MKIDATAASRWVADHGRERVVLLRLVRIAMEIRRYEHEGAPDYPDRDEKFEALYKALDQIPGETLLAAEAEASES